MVKSIISNLSVLYRCFVAKESTESPFSWSVAFVILGLSLYFSLPSEPTLPIILMLSLIFMVIIGVFRHKPWVLSVNMLIFGFVLPCSQAYFISQNQPNFSLQGVSFIEGKIIKFDGVADKKYLLIAPKTIDDEVVSGFLLRISAPNYPDIFTKPLGCEVIVKAKLFGLPKPISNEASDYRVNWWFSKIFSFGNIISDPVFGKGCSGDNFSSQQKLNENFTKTLDSSISPIVIAMVSGQRNNLSTEIIQDFQNSGLIHILSISGLHITMIAGLIFFVIRRLLLIFLPSMPSITIKKTAALVAGLLILFYGGFAEYSPAMIRSIIMTEIIIIAVLVNRVQINIRLLICAFYGLIIYDASIIFNVGFQLSFISVGGFMLIYNVYIEKWRNFIIFNLPFAGILLLFVGIFLSGIITIFLSAPIILYNFGSINFVGIFSNILAIPLMDFLGMPLVFLKILLLGLGEFSLINQSINAVFKLLLHIAQFAANHTIWQITYPRFSDDIMILWFGGIIILFCANNRVKFHLILLVIIACIILYAPIKPAILLANQGRIFAIKTMQNNQEIWLSNADDGYILKQWQQIYRLDNLEYAPLKANNYPIFCDDKNCILRVSDKKSDEIIIFNPSRESWAEDCLRGKIIIMANQDKFDDDCQISVLDKQFFQKNHFVLIDGNYKMRVLATNFTRYWHLL